MVMETLTVTVTVTVTDIVGAGLLANRFVQAHQW
jgi:hypothetical protein